MFSFFWGGAHCDCSVAGKVFYREYSHLAMSVVCRGVEGDVLAVKDKSRVKIASDVGMRGVGASRLENYPALSREKVY